MTTAHVPQKEQTMTAVAQKTERLADRIKVDGPYVVSNDALKSPEELQRRLADSGYLFFKGLLNKDELLKLRADILGLCKEHGWLEPSAPMLDGVYYGGPFPDHHGDYMTLYRKLQKLERFNSFALSPEIIRLFEVVLG